MVKHELSLIDFNSPSFSLLNYATLQMLANKGFTYIPTNYFLDIYHSGIAFMFEKLDQGAVDLYNDTLPSGT